MRPQGAAPGGITLRPTGTPDVRRVGFAARGGWSYAERRLSRGAPTWSPLTSRSTRPSGDSLR